jgi:RNA polymerase sigma factor (sigma-70 family)
MARPVFRRVAAEEEARDRSRVAYLDRDRALVDAARRDPLRFDALYRKYLAQVYSYAYYELGDHHEAEDATERTFLQALAALPRFEERARPADGDGASTFRVWLFQIARHVVANQRRARRRHPETPLEAAAVIADPLDVEGGAAARDEAASAWAAVGRLPPNGAGRCPALRRRDVDRRDRRRPGPVRGCRPRPDPPCAAQRRQGPRGSPVTLRAQRRAIRRAGFAHADARCNNQNRRTDLALCGMD